MIIPIKFVDPNGKWVESADSFSTDDPDEIWAFFNNERGDGEKDKTYEGRTLPEHTVNAPRGFGGVLGRAADLWMENQLDRSTYGSINVNFNHHKLDPLDMKPDYYGFQVEGSFAFYDLGYTLSFTMDEISGKDKGGMLSFSYGRKYGFDASLSFGAHWGYSRKKTIMGHNLNQNDFDFRLMSTSVGYGPISGSSSINQSTYGRGVGLSLSPSVLRASVGIQYSKSITLISW